MNTLGVLIFIAVGGVLNMEVIPERANVKIVNEKYVSDVKFFIRRYSRRSPYYMHLEGRTKQEWTNNNVSVHLYFNEFLHNEYRRSFVELHYKELCKWLNKEGYIGATFRKSACFDAEGKQREGMQENCGENGVKCPVPAGFYRMHNITIPTANFPNVFPFEKCRVDVVLRSEPSGDVMTEIQAFVMLKQKIGK